MGRGSRGRRRGRRKSKAARSSRSKASSSSSSKSKSKRRSTAASKRRRVRSVAKAARAAKRAAKASTSTSSSTSSSSKNKTKRKVNKLKLNKKDRQRQAQENAKKSFQKKNEQQNKKKTISASQSRRQVRQKTKEKIATRKKINMPSLGQVGRTLRNIRQPISALSDAGVRSFLGSPAKAIAQGLANSPYTSDFNKRTRDFSKMSPQMQRKWARLSEKTGRDYSIRNPTFRLNMGVDTLANFGGFADKGWYRALPKSIRSLKVDKQFYGNPMKKGWHSSQRTGRGQGLTPEAATREQLSALRDPIASGTPGFQPTIDWGKYRSPDYQEARLKDDMNRRQEEYNREKEQFAGTDGWLDFYRPENQKRLRDQYTTGIDREGYGRLPRPVGPERPPMPVPDRGGPQQDWLSSLYSSHNIAGGNLTQSARDYWSKEAETKGRDAVMQSIIGTAKAQGTYGGRKKPKRIDTGPRRRFPKGRGVGPIVRPLPLDPRFAGRGPDRTGKPRNLEGNRPKRRGRGRGSLASAALGMATRGWTQ